MRAWRGLDRFEGRAALRSWLYRIATNVCLDMVDARKRRAMPMDFGPAQEPVVEQPQHPAGVDVDRAHSGPRGHHRGSRDDPARIRRRAPAPAAEAARGAHPLRSAPLAGIRGRGAVGDERRLGEQRAPASARDAGRAQSQPRGHAGRRRGGRRAARPLRRRLRVVRHRRAHIAHPRGRHAVDAAVRHVARRPRRHPRLVGRARASAAAIRGSCRPSGRTARRRSASTSRTTQATATSRGHSRCSRSPAARSSASRSSSTPRGFSHSSGCLSSIPRSPHEVDELEQLRGRVLKPNLGACPRARQPSSQPRQRVDRHRVRRDSSRTSTRRDRHRLYRRRELGNAHRGR